MLDEPFVTIEPKSCELQLTSHIIEPWNKKFAIECMWEGVSTHLVFGEKLKKQLEAILASSFFQTTLPKIRIFKDKDDYRIVAL